MSFHGPRPTPYPRRPRLTAGQRLSRQPLPLTLTLTLTLTLIACGAPSPARSAPPSAPAAAPPSAPAAEASSGGASALPARSTLLTESGNVKLDGKMEFFAGWSLSASGQAAPLNLTTLLKGGKARYALTICASWCAPCREGLARISAARDRFEKSRVGLVVLVADTNKHARDLISEFSLGWASVIVDEFNTNAVKLSPNPASPGSLNLPRTFVFDASGKVLSIISQEGEDFIDLLVGDR